MKVCLEIRQDSYLRTLYFTLKNIVGYPGTIPNRESREKSHDLFIKSTVSIIMLKGTH